MRRLFLVLALMSWASIAQAHKPSDSYIALSIQEERVVGQWDIALRDLDFAIGLDADGNGEITWGEVKAKRNDIIAYAMSRLTIVADQAVCPITNGEELIDNHSDGAYVVLRFTSECTHKPKDLWLTYRLFFDIDPQHKGLLRLEIGGETRPAIFGPETARQVFTLSDHQLWRQFLDYLGAGMEHIWTGYDHILFLLSLLLPAVIFSDIKASENRAEGFRIAFLDVLKIVTAFTLAHSITLALATLQIVSVPARISESAIALSVVLAALNNLYPVVRGRRWTVAFGFGLIHGFGFASVLTDLLLPERALALALAGFNLGVEVGQITIVVAFLPIAYVLRKTWLYRGFVFVGGSSLIVMIASLWFLERSLDLRFLPIH
jgi:hypothetical protein